MEPGLLETVANGFVLGFIVGVGAAVVYLCCKS